MRHLLHDPARRLACCALLALAPCACAAEAPVCGWAGRSRLAEGRLRGATSSPPVIRVLNSRGGEFRRQGQVGRLQCLPADQPLYLSIRLRGRRSSTVLRLMPLDFPLPFGPGDRVSAILRCPRESVVLTACEARIYDRAGRLLLAHSLGTEGFVPDWEAEPGPPVPQPDGSMGSGHVSSLDVTHGNRQVRLTPRHWRRLRTDDGTFWLLGEAYRDTTLTIDRPPVGYSLTIVRAR